MEYLSRDRIRENWENIDNFMNVLQDDDMMNMLVDTVKVYSKSEILLEISLIHSDKHLISCLRETLNAHVMFYLFLKKIDFDHNLVVDWLMSLETCILQYLLEYVINIIN